MLVVEPLTTGVHPAIMLMNDGEGDGYIVFVEVHQGQTGVGPLWYSAAILTATRL